MENVDRMYNDDLWPLFRNLIQKFQLFVAKNVVKQSSSKGSHSKKHKALLCRALWIISNDA